MEKAIKIREVSRWGPPLALCVLFAALTAWSWRKWADPLVDFGRELYLGWQVLEGRPLYQELASLFGPLSPHLNALWLHLFGVSLMTLALCNLALAAVLAAAVYRFLVATCDRLTATMGTTVLMVSFIFPHHLGDVANYNFVTPYSHAATHGTVLLVCAACCLSRALLRSSHLAWIAAGLCIGGTLLTKPEIGLAAVATMALALAWHWTNPASSCQRGPLLLITAAALPLVGFSLALGPQALFVPWLSVVRASVSQSAFYAWVTGTDHLATNAARLAVDAGLWIMVAVALVAADLRYCHDSGRQPFIRTAAITVVGLLVVRDIAGVARPLPVLIPVAGAWLGSVAWRRRREDREVARVLPLVLWAMAAWALLAKMALNARFVHYGFYLAMPAALLAVALGIGAVPRLLAERQPGGGWLVRSVSVSMVALLLVHSFICSTLSYAWMSVPVGRGLDLHLGRLIRPFPTGTTAASALERIEALTPSDATLAVLPEGAMLNFLTRRPNPTPYHQLMPPEMEVYGASRVLAAFRERPPECVVIIERPGFEYGVDSFTDPRWGGDLVAWVRTRYEVIETVPNSNNSWGFTLWCRHDTPRSAERHTQPVTALPPHS